MVNLVKDMIPVRNMNLSQILRAGVRSDLPNGQKRLCLSYLIAGLFASAFLVNNCSPVIFDLIPCFKRKQGTTEEDFEEENGSIDIKDCMPLSMRMIEYTLNNYSKIYVEGQDVMTAFLDYIKEKEYITVRLSDAQMDMIDSDYKSNRRRTGGQSVAHAFLLKHPVKGTIISFYCSWQISSTIARVSMKNLLLHQFILIVKYLIFYCCPQPENIHRPGNLFIPTFHNFIGSFCRPFGAKCPFSNNRLL